MRFYLHAFCLDENKAKEGHEEMWVGPFEWFQITWDWLRAGDDNGDYEDHQFFHDENGFWYAYAYVTDDATKGGSMQPDYERGRFSDISMVAERDLITALNASMPEEGVTVSQTTERITNDRAALVAAKQAENEWIEEYTEE